MRRKCCQYCWSNIEINGEAHKCSEKELILAERKALRKAKQELEDIIDPERTFGDKLWEAEIMMTL